MFIYGREIIQIPKLCLALDTSFSMLFAAGGSCAYPIMTQQNSLPNEDTFHEVAPTDTSRELDFTECLENLPQRCPGRCH